MRIIYCLDPDVSKSSIVPKLTVTLISNLHISYMYMSNKAESRVLLEKYEHLLNKTILVYQVRLGEETWSMAAQETLAHTGPLHVVSPLPRCDPDHHGPAYEQRRHANT